MVPQSTIPGGDSAQPTNHQTSGHEKAWEGSCGSQPDRQTKTSWPHPLIPTYSEVHLASNYLIFFSSLSFLTICSIFPSRTLRSVFTRKKKRCSPHPPPPPQLAQVYIGPLSHCEGFEPTSDSTLEPLPPSKPPTLCLSQQPSTTWSSRSHWNMGLPDEGAVPHIWTVLTALRQPAQAALVSKASPRAQGHSS